MIFFHLSKISDIIKLWFLYTSRYSAAPGAWGNRRWNYKIDLNTHLTYTILYRYDIHTITILPPPGGEPGSSASESDTLSITLWKQYIYLREKFSLYTTISKCCWLKVYSLIKAPVCQWVCLFVCLFPNFSKTSNPSELKFWGMILLGI